MKPVLLPPNQPPRFYRGGSAIAAFRGLAAGRDDVPEDWVGSATTLFGEGERGLSRLPDGRFLRDAIAADPETFVGPEHARRFGAQPELLVKLLHAGERLPVHAHPSRAWSRRHLACPWGKTEAWVVVGEPGTVHLGFARDVDAEELARWVDTQDADALLGALHALPVQDGDAVLVPAGMPHAIGEGLLVVELQEPSDLSVLMEWTGFDVDGTRDGHLGIGFEQALTAVDRSGIGRDRLDALRRRRGAERDGLVHPVGADPYFRCERLAAPPAGALDPGLAVLVGIDGVVELRFDDGEIEVRRGETWLVPYAAGAGTVDGSGELLRCRPPAA
ncbi:MAG TPA: class I mannose-6-phosphate isomerase [Gaiellaceae bacterium]